MANKTVLITGGTGKIGAIFVQHFTRQGFNVLFTSRHTSKIESLIKVADPDKLQIVRGICVDFQEPGSIQTTLDWINELGLFPNSVINNARCLDYLKVDENMVMPRTNWMGEFLIDVVIPYELVTGIVGRPQSRLESVVNISSMYGVVPPNPNLYEKPEFESPINYGVAKAALLHLTKELAIRLAPKNIRVNSISYGGVQGRATEVFERKYAALCPMGRMLKDHEVVGAVDFLVSDNSLGMTGQNLVVDGGWTVW